MRNQTGCLGEWDHEGRHWAAVASGAIKSILLSVKSCVTDRHYPSCILPESAQRRGNTE